MKGGEVIVQNMGAVGEVTFIDLAVNDHYLDSIAAPAAGQTKAVPLGDFIQSDRRFQPSQQAVQSVYVGDGLHKFKAHVFIFRQ